MYIRRSLGLGPETDDSLKFELPGSLDMVWTPNSPLGSKVVHSNYAYSRLALNAANRFGNTCRVGGGARRFVFRTRELRFSPFSYPRTPSASS